MTGRQPSRRDGDEGIDAFMARRRLEAAKYGPGARAAAYAAAHEAYRDSIRTGRDLQLVQPGDLLLYGGALGDADEPGAEPPPDSDALPDVALAMPQPSGDEPGPADPEVPPPTSSIGRPGLAESFIPVWGSGREAIADFQEGNYLGAALNAGLAASDLFVAGTLAKAVGKAMGKGGLKGGAYALLGPIWKGGATDWDNISRHMRNLGMLEKGQHGHHWLIPNNRWGKYVPNSIKNHPFNIKAMPSDEIHMRVHNKWRGMPRFGYTLRYWHGTPHVSKAATVSTGGHGSLAVETGGREQ
ncbi:hypothetical protein [Arenibaculum pallidiluteum]|uniref:hypothetical protein n=1 Tax=Arenibaculum pallidiluteum TaxID=2812559 RepID=UPI001A974125|nr:hypothetical protein [Arenibaculum pallidiluteum]